VSGFLSRWSRRKAARRHVADVAAVPDVPPELPAIESLGPDSDFTVFLARGVPSAVQSQALRIAWASDPAIANFRGMAEYAWDFNAPGYGDLAAGDNVATLVSQVVRSAPQRLFVAIADGVVTGEAAAPLAIIAEPTAPQDVTLPCAVPGPDPVPEVPAAASQPLPQRHGGALPV
jgi:hypothetical protein